MEQRDWKKTESTDIEIWDHDKKQPIIQVRNRENNREFKKETGRNEVKKRFQVI